MEQGDSWKLGGNLPLDGASHTKGKMCAASKGPSTPSPGWIPTTARAPISTALLLTGNLDSGPGGSPGVVWALPPGFLRVGFRDFALMGWGAFWDCSTKHLLGMRVATKSRWWGVWPHPRPPESGSQQTVAPITPSNSPPPATSRTASSGEPLPSTIPETPLAPNASRPRLSCDSSETNPGPRHAFLRRVYLVLIARETERRDAKGRPVVSSGLSAWGSSGSCVSDSTPSAVSRHDRIVADLDCGRRGCHGGKSGLIAALTRRVTTSRHPSVASRLPLPPPAGVTPLHLYASPRATRYILRDESPLPASARTPPPPQARRARDGVRCARDSPVA
ncbi:hypothetical protein BDK51DRAFT_43018 [Blyttiomyces helicus]|uniref:Uncharacterized protein n=1 Tax=Blyttiomyces helicus TaxID=388810 RepID=A0A4P9WNC5_9FUNG|nr:hypothetical protein BDK51DRAFT_43018 [Blyttiomyces helicus]|eukprot:RKO94444.1 hypothetical protein BDK51DRAFT_43018 [Blyttiomyces helicus]